MIVPRSVLCTTILATVSLSLGGCIKTTRAIQKRAPSTNVRTASLDQLISLVDQQGKLIQTVNATVEIAPSIQNQKKGKVEDYQEFPGYLLIKKPSELRLIGLIPVVRSHLFDMVSNGLQFKLSIPPKNKFVEGTSEVTHVSDNAIENIRPKAILDALLLPEIDPKNDIAVIRSGTEHVQDLHDRKKILELPTYVLEILKHESNHWYISRSVVISRIDLKPHVQQIYDTEGNVVTEATYENFTDIDGISFPYLIRILRPKEQYEINIAIVKLRLNQPLTDDQFQLKQPEGSQLQVLK